MSCIPASIQNYNNYDEPGDFNATPFSEIPRGQFFRYGGALYMKVSNEVCAVNAMPVNFIDYKPCTIREDEDVYLVRADVSFVTDREGDTELSRNTRLKEAMTIKGYWIHKNDDYNDWYVCSRCEYGDEGEVKDGQQTPYCPHCGARMDYIEE